MEKINLLRHLQAPQNDMLINQIDASLYGERRPSSDIAPESAKHRHKLTIHILSTHGSRAECGLTEIDVYDETGE